jgi:hypothetical protein
MAANTGNPESALIPAPAAMSKKFASEMACATCRNLSISEDESMALLEFECASKNGTGGVYLVKVKEIFILPPN